MGLLTDLCGLALQFDFPATLDALEGVVGFYPVLIECCSFSSNLLLLKSLRIRQPSFIAFVRFLDTIKCFLWEKILC